MLVLGQDGKLKRLRRGSDLDAATRNLHTQACERRAFESLAMRPPAFLPVDLVIKALLWAPILLLAAGGLKYLVQSPGSEREPADIPAAIVLAAVNLVRLIYLHRIGSGRHAPMGWLWKGAALIVLIGLAVPLEPGATS
jgi:hypothetical protein